MTIAVRNTGRAPQRAASQPLSGMNTASVTMYAAMTSPTEVEATWRASPIRGAAVVTIVPSRFSMKKQPATSKAVLRRRRSVISSGVRLNP